MLRVHHPQPARTPSLHCAIPDFLRWCAEVGAPSIAAIQPLHVAAWVEVQICERAASTAKLGLAAVRHLSNWLVTGQVIPTNPATSVRGPSHVLRQGKTPVLEPAKAQTLFVPVLVSRSDKRKFWIFAGDICEIRQYLACVITSA